MNNNGKNNKRTIVIVLIIGILIGAGGGLMFYFLNPQGGQAPQEPKGVVGVVTDDWNPDISQPEASPGENSRQGTKIPGYSYAEMNEGDMTLRLSVGNPKDNIVGMYATVMLRDGTELYTSQLLEPGQGVVELPLTQTLKKGEYDALVRFRCVTLDESHSPLNSAESGFRLYVK